MSNGQTICKYPRTPHLVGSQLQPGDEELTVLPMSELQGKQIIIEEKLDGANAGISFDDKGKLLLQSRGHFLDGGPRERHFALFKRWAASHCSALWPVLRDRYLIYGEWLYAKHTVFYDALPHYFIEFDVYDRSTGSFLSTAGRRRLLRELPIVSVPVIAAGGIHPSEDIVSLITASSFQTARWQDRLREVCREQGLSFERAFSQTDDGGLMEGLYLKVEDGPKTLERYKFVRASFTQAVADSEGHWLDRPIIPNQLRAGVDVFAPHQ